MDRISELPEFIRHRILNFLDRKEVARTAVLSKAWRRTVEYRPVLEFIEPNFPRWEVRKALFFIDESIQKFINHKLCIHKFVLKISSYCSDTPLWDSALRRWMELLVNEADIKHLSLLMLRTGGNVVLPPIIFCSRTITSLRLENCSLEHCHGAKLPNLLELNIERSTVSQDGIQGLLSGCPNLEICRIQYCSAPKSICFLGIPRLKTLVLNIEFSGCASTLRKLELTDDSVKSLEGHDIFTNFPRLEELTLAHDYKLKCLQIQYHPVLSNIDIFRCTKLEKVEIDAPNLRLLKYHRNKLPYSVTTSFSVDDTLDLNHYFDKPQFNHALENCKQLLLKLNQYKYIKFIVDYFKDAIVCDKLDEKFINMVMGDNNSGCFMNVICVTTKTDECMLDYLFTFRPWRTISLISRDHRINKKLIQAMNKKTLKDNEEPICCRSEERKCWQHHLHSVDMMYEDSIDKLETPNVFKYYDSVEYDITRVKLHWNIPESRRYRGFCISRW